MSILKKLKKQNRKQSEAAHNRKAKENLAIRIFLHRLYMLELTRYVRTVF